MKNTLVSAVFAALLALPVFGQPTPIKIPILVDAQAQRQGGGYFRMSGRTLMNVMREGLTDSRESLNIRVIDKQHASKKDHPLQLKVDFEPTTAEEYARTHVSTSNRYFRGSVSSGNEHTDRLLVCQYWLITSEGDELLSHHAIATSSQDVPLNGFQSWSTRYINFMTSRYRSSRDADQFIAEHKMAAIVAQEFLADFSIYLNSHRVELESVCNLKSQIPAFPSSTKPILPPVTAPTQQLYGAPLDTGGPVYTYTTKLSRAELARARRATTIEIYQDLGRGRERFRIRVPFRIEGHKAVYDLPFEFEDRDSYRFLR